MEQYCEVIDKLERAILEHESRQVDRALKYARGTTLSRLEKIHEQRVATIKEFRNLCENFLKQEAVK